MTEKEKLQLTYSRQKNWLRWGPYLSERQWGTVREDYSEWGTCWDYFPHEHARSRTYRWGEDGLFGWSDRQCRLCLSLALWNGKDPILKERLFGLNGDEGNHGEDVKEFYFYETASPTHSYNKSSYIYPHAEFPYADLLKTNKQRSRQEPEYDLKDTRVLDQGWFEVSVEYVKTTENETLIQYTIQNKGKSAELTFIPQIWYRNTWDWGRTDSEEYFIKPNIKVRDEQSIEADHESLGKFYFSSVGRQEGEWILTENQTNEEKLFGRPNQTHVKDGFHDYVIEGSKQAINHLEGTKAGYLLTLNLQAEETKIFRFQLSNQKEQISIDDFDSALKEERKNCRDFYQGIIPQVLNNDQKEIIVQAYAGLLWSKQFYHYVIEEWLKGDPGLPTPPVSRLEGRNHDWKHLHNRDIISMPDKWEYPWYACWDSAFHMLPFATIDGEFAKSQLILFLREWYMHPNGQIPAYEFAFEDVNPPVHAWACWRVYKLSAPKGERDIAFLGRAFQKLLLNFTWWINRKDPDGKNIFSGGFLGLDNIGMFDRSKDIPEGGTLYQADGTAWMAFFCTNMLAMALELAEHDKVYADMASKFFEHYVSIVDSINSMGGTGLWDEEDGFYYDHLKVGNEVTALKVRSLVGLVPLLSVQVLENEVMDNLPEFSQRTEWFLRNRAGLAKNISCLHEGGEEIRRLLAVPSKERFERILKYLFAEGEFLSEWGIRSLSKYHHKNPFSMDLDGQTFSVKYSPGESDTNMFGGNSNWRGPIWMPMNYLIIESLERYHYFYGDTFKVEFPTGSGNRVNLQEAATEIAQRLIKLFTLNNEGIRPSMGSYQHFQKGESWESKILFYEYFNAETGEGLGASHQTGWTALILRLIKKYSV